MRASDIALKAPVLTIFHRLSFSRLNFKITKFVQNKTEINYLCCKQDVKDEKIGLLSDTRVLG